LGYAKVNQNWPSVLVEDHIRRFNVAVYHTCRTNRGQGLLQVTRQGRQIGGLPGTMLGDVPRQGGAFDQFSHNEHFGAIQFHIHHLSHKRRPDGALGLDFTG
jgi:hypothetical protein